MKINVTIDISRDILESVFVTAIEGGSNYWYHIGNEAIDIIREAVTDKDGKAFSEMLFETVYDHGKAVPIGDIEDIGGEPIGELNINTFQERLQKCAQENMWAISEEIKCEGDATSSDVIFQYLALNDLIYG